MDETYTAEQVLKIRKLIKSNAAPTAAKVIETTFDGLIITTRLAFNNAVAEAEARKIAKAIAGSKFRFMGAYEGHLEIKGTVTQIFTVTLM